ncbi:hypothetical protein OG439_07930 [Amycolatopsis sp. NBC_01307]|uniref:hypothetical protein n=1 Tax=Amycolatopsis sp. NBC_01307 TaxID=2903561 RepID=UPI002E0F7F18|nr:hypothetical protein OG439_07930 [Amycolatopsis sp. NBC_01307]
MTSIESENSDDSWSDWDTVQDDRPGEAPASAEPAAEDDDPHQWPVSFFADGQWTAIPDFPTFGLLMTYLANEVDQVSTAVLWQDVLDLAPQHVATGTEAVSHGDWGGLSFVLRDRSVMLVCAVPPNVIADRNRAALAAGDTTSVSFAGIGLQGVSADFHPLLLLALFELVEDV